MPSGRRQGLAVVLDPGITDLADPRPLVLTEDKWAGRLGPIDFPTPVSALARVRVPKNFNHRSPHARRDLASTLRNARLENDLGARKVKHRSAASDDPVLDDLRRALRAHPVHELPDREDRVRVAERWLRAVREADALQHKMAERTGSLTRQFDATCDVLEELGYLVPEVAPLVPADTEVVGAADDLPVVTDDGRRLVADLVGGRPAGRRVPPGGGLARADADRAGRGRLDGWSSRRAATTRRCPPSRPARWRRRSARCAASGSGCTTSRPTTASA